MINKIPDSLEVRKEVRPKPTAASPVRRGVVSLFSPGWLCWKLSRPLSSLLLMLSTGLSGILLKNSRAVSMAGETISAILEKIDFSSDFSW